jgi:hypothetical protein
MSLINQQLNTSLTQALELYNQHVVPRLTKKNKVIAISTAVALSVYVLVDRLFKPPKKLRHIPYQGYYSFLKGIFHKDTYDTKAKKFYLPTISSTNGIYMVRNIHAYTI